eukprot:UC4_evm2s1049
MDDWSAVLEKHTDSNAPLQAGWAASVWARSGEIMKHYDSRITWSGADRFANMLSNVYAPLLLNGSSANGNWELTFIEGLIGIAVFTENHSQFETAINLWRRHLFLEDMDRIVTGLEFNFGLLLDGESNRAVPKWLCEGDVLGINPRSHGLTGEVFLKYYVGKLGLTLPNITKQVKSYRPTGAGLHMVWETLTHGIQLD